MAWGFWRTSSVLDRGLTLTEADLQKTEFGSDFDKADLETDQMLC
jgi:hypothetical protein